MVVLLCETKHRVYTFTSSFYLKSYLYHIILYYTILQYCGYAFLLGEFLRATCRALCGHRKCFAIYLQISERALLLLLLPSPGLAFQQTAAVALPHNIGVCVRYPMILNEHFRVRYVSGSTTINSVV